MGSDLNNEHDWIKRLVRSEAEMLKTGTADFFSHQDHRKVVAQSTVEFMRELKAEAVRCVDLFNAYRGGAHLQNSIKVFHVADTQADFILFRNGLKLAVTNKALGIIKFTFVSRQNPFQKNAGKAHAMKNKSDGYELIAQLYPFNELAWTFQGERVQPRTVIRYMVTEFIKSSAVM